MKSKAGYQYNIFRKLLKLFVDFLCTILFLKKSSLYSNELFQSIDLKEKVNFDGKNLLFKTGHNRLRSRVKNFFTDEPMIIDWLKNFNENDIFLDIGANVGSYTIAALSKGSYVYSLELDLNNSSKLFENIFLNKLFNNSVILPFGVGQKNAIESIHFRDFTVGDCLQTIGNEPKIPTAKMNPFQMSQPIFKLDDLFSLFSLKQPNKIKIDVDGNEKFVFEGGRNIILGADEIYYEDIGSEEDKYIINEILDNNFKIKSEMPATNRLQGRNDRNILFKKN
jgi:FkbM family methyltransferase